MSLEYTIRELAKRHKLEVDALVADWNERAAQRQYSGLQHRPMAELEALHDIERMHRIGQHAPRPQQPAALDAGPDVRRRRAVRKPRPGDSHAG